MGKVANALVEMCIWRPFCVCDQISFGMCFVRNSDGDRMENATNVTSTRTGEEVNNFYKYR
jgi:hypothetical protein